MTESLVPLVHTVIDARSLYDALATTIGGDPPRHHVLCLAAQVFVETANGHSAYCWNTSGIKYTTGCARDFYEVKTHETLNGVDTIVTAAFRAYPSLAAACADYVHILRAYYGPAWLAASVGDLAGFSAGLARWHTSNVTQYTAALQARYALLEQMLPETVAIAHGPPAPGTDEDPQPTPPGDLTPPDEAA